MSEPAANPSPDHKDDGLLSRLKQLVFVGLALVLVLGTWALLGPKRHNSGLLHYGQVPHFILTQSDDRPFDSAILDGKVWIASFVFTSCKNSCPMLGAQMKRLSSSLPAGEGFALLSLTVDPKKDTPAVLRKYAKALGAEDPRWYFLTGTIKDLKSLIQDGFRLAAEPGDEALDERGHPDILHSSKLVLIDKHGNIRGYYDGLLGASVEAIRRDAERLATEK